jgi:hypothetical protein
MNLEFEDRNMGIHHERCMVCRQVSTNLVLLRRTPMCTKCRTKSIRKPSYVPPWLPTWVDEKGSVHYTVPDCLRILREGEKLLIQRISTYVPLRYMKGGAHGSKGHVCSFPKELQEFVTELPRRKVEAIKVIRRFVDTDKEVNETTFTIRRKVVMRALYWLKQNNKHYKDIIIKEDNLDWMEEKEEAELEVTVLEKDDEEELVSAVNIRLNEEEPIPAYGIIRHDNEADLPKYKDIEATEAVKDLQEHRKQNVATNARDSSSPAADDKCTMEFPKVLPEAVNEYDDSLRIFCLAFPWLFPGGVGDWADVPTAEDMKVEDWARRLVHYEDGRFAKDKIWCFYALNFVQRRQNMKQGNYFVKSFLGSGCPNSLDELKKVIEKGDTSWIDKICYFGNVVKGSTAYWRQRRDEIHSWIQYHVLKGNGAPSMFLTLSCAEHYWPDVKRLLDERSSFEDNGENDTAMSTRINEYTLVIQEYFQQRVRNWLDTVGKVVFKIRHHWLRFEFAPGRGQIHAHCLLITDNMETQKRAHEALKNALERDIMCDMEYERARVYQEWVETDLAMITSIPEKFDKADINIDMKGEAHPASTRLHDVTDLSLDGTKLLMSVQTHVCTTYCMKKRKIL